MKFQIREIIKETKKAIYVSFRTNCHIGNTHHAGKAVWVPKSIAKVVGKVIEVPGWFAKKSLYQMTLENGVMYWGE